MLDRARAVARGAPASRAARGSSAATSATFRFDPRCFDLVMAPVRHPAVAHARTRSAVHAGIGRARAAPRRAVRASISFLICRAGTSTQRKLSLRGRRSATTTLTLIESVRQDRRRRLTIFDQEYIERRGRTRRRSPLRADVPHAVGATDGRRASKRRVSRSARSSATIRAGRGTIAPTCGSSSRAGNEARTVAREVVHLSDDDDAFAGDPRVPVQPLRVVSALPHPQAHF